MLGRPSRGKLLRRISTKLVVAVLTTVILPFVAFAFFINEQMADRLTRHVVQQSLLGLAKDLAGQLDYFVEERRQDVEQWAESPLSNAAVDDYIVDRTRRERAVRGELDGGLPLLSWDAEMLARMSRGDVSVEDRQLDLRNRAESMREFDRFIDIKRVYDLILLVADDGRLVTCSSRSLDGGDSLNEGFLAWLFERDYSVLPWFQGALGGQIYQLDHHVSPSRVAEYGEDQDAAWNYHLGFAAPVRKPRANGDVRGVLFTLVNWKFLQDVVSTPVLKDAFRGLVAPGEDPSPYAWIWAADADTILAHPNRSLYYGSVSALGLPQLNRAVLENEQGWGLYPEYEFQGEDKNAAFKRSAPVAEGGFGWVVGVGIDNRDIYATADELRRLLLGGTAVILLISVAWTFVIAKRTTGPILDLQRSVRRVARGDLDSRADTSSKDELGALAEDFNSMTRELKSQREMLIKAEKDAAWREMARQIAHDIKNPLTPIKLSLDLLERVRRENAPGSDDILDRTMALMNRQVEHLRQIAGDFYEFTGGRKPRPASVDLGQMLEEVLHLHDAWAVKLGVDVQREGEDVIAWVDPDKVRRVFVNLVSNAMQAMPEGGELLVYVCAEGGRAVVTVRDTGGGIPEEARAHLFEPYFTTKSEGTGLGLAISKRVIEESDGEIELASRPPEEGGGTVAYVRLPLFVADESA